MGYFIGSQPIIDNSLILFLDPKNTKSYPTYNLLTFTEDFSNAAWQTQNTSKIIGVGLTPEGKSFYTITCTSNGFNQVFQANIGENKLGDYYSFEVVCKKGTSSRIAFRFNEAAFPRDMYDFNTDTFINTLVPENTLKASREFLGDGWIRIKYSGIVKNSANFSIYQAEGNNGIDGISGNTLLISYAQVNKGSSRPYQPVLTTAPTLVTSLTGTNNGTLTNGALADNGSGVITIGATNQYVQLGNVLPNPGSLTLSCWTKLDSISSGNLFGRWGELNVNSHRSYFLGVSAANKPTLNLTELGTSNNIYVADGTITLGKWVNIVGVYDVSIPSVTMYIDGVKQTGSFTSGTIPTSLYNGTSEYHIGWQTATNTSQLSNMAMIMQYNRALSSSEVLQNYNATKDRFKK